MNNNILSIFMCIVEGCNIKARYGIAAPTHCVKHKSFTMIDTVSPKCKALACKKSANYGLDADVYPTYCVGHKLDNMKIIQSVVCVHAGCTSKSSFNKPWRIKGLYCTQHAEPDMENKNTKKCKHEGV